MEDQKMTAEEKSTFDILDETRDTTGYVHVSYDQTYYNMLVEAHVSAACKAIDRFARLMDKPYRYSREAVRHYVEYDWDYSESTLTGKWVGMYEQWHDKYGMSLLDFCYLDANGVEVTLYPIDRARDLRHLWHRHEIANKAWHMDEDDVSFGMIFTDVIERMISKGAVQC